MYNLGDYIILTRSSFLLRTTDLVSVYDDSQYNSYENIRKIDNGLANLMEILYPGSSVTKYIVSVTKKLDTPQFVPIHILTIPGFDNNGDLIVPIFITGTDVFMVKTIFKPVAPDEIVVEREPFLIKLMNTYDLLSNDGPLQMSDFVKNAPIVTDDIIGNLKVYQAVCGGILNKIYNMYSSVSEFSFTESKLSADDAKTRFIEKNYTMDLPDSENYYISPDMFMPLVVKKDDSDTSTYIRLCYEDKPTSPESKVITTLTTINPLPIPEYNSEDESKNKVIVPDKNLIIVKNTTDAAFMILNINTMIYVGNGLLLMKTSNDPNKMFKLDLNFLSLYMDKEELDSIDIENLSREVALESMTTSVKKIIQSAKEVGMNVRADVFPFVRKLLGLPKDLVNLVLKFMTKAFNTVNLLEKNKSLDYQEKLLNDELSSFSETLSKLVSYGGIALSVAFIPTNLLCKIIIFVLAKSVHDDIKVRAIERVEHRLDDIIQRLNKKIEFATQEYNKEAVNELKKEKALYMFALERLLEVKEKVYKRSRKKSAYKLENEDGGEE